MHEVAGAIPAWLWKIITIAFIVGQKPNHGNGGGGGGKGGNGSMSIPGHNGGGGSANPTNPIGPTSITSETGTGTGTGTKTSTSTKPTHSSPVPEQQCSDGAEWDTFSDDMSTLDTNSWSLDGGDKSMIGFDDGLTLHINQTNIYITLAHKRSWIPPVTVEADIIAAGIGGVPTAMVMKDSTTSGAEIDLEITEYDKGGGSKQPNYQMQLPIWKPSNGQGDATKLAKDGSELQETLHNGFYEDKGNPGMPEWGYTYPNYNAKKWISYKLEWFPDSITWYSEGSKRISYANKNKNSFPHTPLPFRAGLWAVSKETTAPNNNWAGNLNWAANKSPSMSIKNVKIAACRSNKKV